VVDPVKVVVNPYAGRWRAKQMLAGLESALQTAGVPYELAHMERPGHGITLAREAALAGSPLVVAAGGDGTVSEVMNGLIGAAGEAEAGVLGIVPLGSANDLATILNIPLDLKGACQRLALGKTRLIDVGLVNGRYFDNNSAVGLEPMVTLESMKMERIKGPPRYVVAALRGIWKTQPWRMRLVWDAGEYEGEVTLVSVGNSPITGGAFRMTPNAQIDDGLLDFIFAPAMSRWKLLRLLPLTFSGAHVRHPLVRQARTAQLRISCSPPTPIQADGEIISRNATEIRYSIVPRKLRVVV
jgi:diacylglycerol kinase (ATP)